MSEPAAPPPKRASTEPPETGSNRGALIALLVVVVLAIGGYLLSQRLRSANRIQDCVMAGRSNCAPVQ